MKLWVHCSQESFHFFFLPPCHHSPPGFSHHRPPGGLMSPLSCVGKSRKIPPPGDRHLWRAVWSVSGSDVQARAQRHLRPPEMGAEMSGSRLVGNEARSCLVRNVSQRISLTKEKYLWEKNIVSIIINTVNGRFVHFFSEHIDFKFEKKCLNQIYYPRIVSIGRSRWYFLMIEVVTTTSNSPVISYKFTCTRHKFHL